MKRILIIVLMYMTTLGFFTTKSVKTQEEQPVVQYTNEACYLCSKAGTYVKFCLPDTYKKRMKAKLKHGCEVIKKVRSCGYNGQNVLGTIK